MEEFDKDTIITENDGDIKKKIIFDLDLKQYSRFR